jgi:hypothetical protein
MLVLLLKLIAAAEAAAQVDIVITILEVLEEVES